MSIMRAVTLTAFKEWPKVVIAMVYESEYNEDTTACSWGFMNVDCDDNEDGTAAKSTTEILLLEHMGEFKIRQRAERQLTDAETDQRERTVFPKAK